MGLFWIAALAYILSSIFMINLMNCCVDAQHDHSQLHNFHMKRKYNHSLLQIEGINSKIPFTQSVLHHKNQ